MYDRETVLNRLYFNNSVTKEEKEKIEGLVLEVCEGIERKCPKDLTHIFGNLAFIIFRALDIDNTINSGSCFGGLTQKSMFHCFIVYFPFDSRFNHKTTYLYILAHEFAHVYYEHPIDNPFPSQSVIEKYELEADNKAVDWGFKLGFEDIKYFPGYQRLSRDRKIQ